MTVVALAGDWHGNGPWATGLIQSIGDRGVRTIWHLGDFGIWPGRSGKRYLLGIDEVCERAGVDEVLVTPGNHEDWGRFTQMWSLGKYRDPETGDLLPLRLAEHVTVLPRGHTWEMEGRRLVSLGGAPSIDFERRTLGRDWWPEEMIQPADVERTIRNGAGADVMLAHDSPGAPWRTLGVSSICTSNPDGWSRSALEWAAQGRTRMSEAFRGVAPSLFVHGHYHCHGEATKKVAGVGHETRIWSLNRDGAVGNLRYLDLETLTDPEWAL